MNESKDEIVEFDNADLDCLWEGDGEDAAETADGAQTLRADRPEGEQQPEHPPAAPETNRTPGGADPLQRIDIVYRGKKEQLTVDEARPLIQKGRDYDTVRAERDRLRAEQADNAAAVDMVRRQAQSMGKSVGEYLSWCRQQELMGSGRSKEEAEQMASAEQRRVGQKARLEQRMEAARQEVQRKGERRKEFTAFFKAYPGVKPEQIPKEVWQRVKGGEPLLSAYAMHENARLQAQLAAERQNKVNKLRSPGGLGANSGREPDEIDRLWGEDD